MLATLKTYYHEFTRLYFSKYLMINKNCIHGRQQTSILHHDWYSKGRGMWCPVCMMVHIKDSLLLIENSSPF